MRRDASGELQTNGDDDKPLISVVIPVLNAARFLAPCLDSVVGAMDACAGARVELIIIDNGSTDGSWELLQGSWSALARVSRVPGVNVGAVRNRGAAEAKGSILSFIDADCVVPPDYFDQALQVLSRTGADATGSTYALPPEPAWVERTWFRLHEPRAPGPVPYLNAGNFICRVGPFRALGGFDEALQTGEDAELGMRWRRAGYEIFEDPSVVALHLGNPKSLGHFFRKQRWHGLGALGTFSHHWRDLPLLATLANFGSWLVAMVVLALLPAEPLAWVAGGALVLLVPLMAVVFRGVITRRVPPLLGGTVLYAVYFAARLAALYLVFAGRVSRGHRG